jgi:hypothetical protein
VLLRGFRVATGKFNIDEGNGKLEETGSIKDENLRLESSKKESMCLRLIDDWGEC